MRRHLAVVLGVASAVLLASGLLTAAAPARVAADDVSIDVHLRFSTATTTNGLNFQIELEIGSTAGVEQMVVVRTTLPAGLTWGSDAPDPTEDCVTANPAVCTAKLRQNEVGTFGLGWFWDVVAERAGTYEIVAFVEPTDTDPDASNNTDTFRLEVVQPSTGGGGSGGGGSGGGGGGAAASAGAAKLSPAKPRAGATVSATVRVTAGGAPVRPSRIACAGAIGTAKMKGVGKAASSSATCTFRTPRSAKGKTLRGSVSFTARGSRFTKRFAARLG